MYLAILITLCTFYGSTENSEVENNFLIVIEKCKSKNNSAICFGDKNKVVKWNSNNCDCFDSSLRHFKRQEALWHSGEIPKPRMLCRTPTKLTFSWKDEKEAAYYFVHLQQHQDPYRFLIVTPNGLLTVENLRQETKYRPKIQVVFKNGTLSSESEGDWTSTLEENYAPGEINNITVAAWYPKIGSLNAVLSWKPSFERSCSYELVCHQNLDYFTKIIKKPEELYYANLTNLTYDTNYSIAVTGIYEKGKVRIEGRKIWQVVTTPSCLSLNNNSLAICPPEKIKKLQIEEELISIEGNSTFYKVKIFWEALNPVPDIITVSLEKLQIRHSQRQNVYRNEILGDQTGFVFDRIDLGSYYRVRVWATSKGGSSPSAEQYRQLKLESDKYSELPNDSIWRIYIISPILGTFLIIAVIFFMYCRIKLTVKKKILQKEQLNFEKKISYGKQNSAGKLTETCATDEYEIPFENIIFEEVLGEGAFGVVRKGILKKNTGIQEVAVKMLREKPTSSDVQQFRQEIDMLKGIGKHPHIVSLIGCCTRASSRMLLIVEYCHYGDLRNYLQTIYKEMTSGKKMKTIQEKSLHNYENFKRNIAVNKLYDLEYYKENNATTAVDLLSFARQIAIGMEFLASNRIVHRDVAARNVLICQDKTVKISDFGLSRDVYERNFYLKGGDGKVPIKWMAIESLIYQKYTTQSDVWSFGVLLWEIVTFGAVPYPGVPSTRIIQLLTNGYRMSKPGNCSQELYDVMLSCWNAKPNERPTFSDLRKQLDFILENSTSFQYISLEESTSFDCVIALSPQ